MLITWMAYATLLGVAISAAAFAVEHIVAIWSGARRAVWVVALAAGVLTPLVIVVMTRGSQVPTNVRDGVQRITLDGSLFGGGSAVASNSAYANVARAIPLLDRIDKSAPTLWLLASTLLFALFLRASVTLRGRRAEWRTARVDGCDVLVAREVGPAVVGAWRPRIVFPEWALALGDDERMLMLRHEREHVTARDPLLLLVAALAIILVPWNAALWLVVRRLRLAVEIDCDARVLRTMNRPREYGMLLLAVGARNGTTLPYAASLAERKPFLERRIRAMTTIRPSHPVLASVVLGVVAIATTTLAAQAPRPEPMVVGVGRAAATNERAQRSVDVAPRSAVAPNIVQTKASHSAANASASPGVKRADSVIEPTAPTSSPLATRAGVTLSTSEFTATASDSPSQTKGGDISFEVIRGWIAKHHPEVVSGAANVALVTIIVDANDNYVSSTTDAAAPSEPPAGKIPVDSIAQIEVLKGADAVDLYGSAALNGVIVVTTKGGHGGTSGAFAVGTPNLAGRPGQLNIYPKSTNDTTRAQPMSLRTLVPISANIPRPLFVIDGVVVDSPDPVAHPTDQLDKLGLASDGIQSVQILKAAAGRVGPNALSVVVVKLKP
ncbi:MAG TPA: M56 family metallopeptidase [Gemmatimonadaceae bacterium]|jgi:TonB-dependent SusC/RagA subfamily outer membrane receptor